MALQKCQCDTSDKVFSSGKTSKSCNLYYKTHRCTFCDKTFTNITNLFIHYRSHTQETPYFCSLCDKMFTSSAGLKSHGRFHTGEKPFSCKTRKISRHTSWCTLELRNLAAPTVKNPLLENRI